MMDQMFRQAANMEKTISYSIATPIGGKVGMLYYSEENDGIRHTALRTAGDMCDLVNFYFFPCKDIHGLALVTEYDRLGSSVSTRINMFESADENLLRAETISIINAQTTARKIILSGEYANVPKIKGEREISKGGRQYKILLEDRNLREIISKNKLGTCGFVAKTHQDASGMDAVIGEHLNFLKKLTV